MIGRTRSICFEHRDSARAAFSFGAAFLCGRTAVVANQIEERGVDCATFDGYTDAIEDQRRAWERGFVSHNRGSRNANLRAWQCDVARRTRAFRTLITVG